MNADKSSLILLVDDNPKNLQVLGTLLADYTTAVATNGRDTLKFVARRPPDLILLDVMMPDMDGFAVCRTLQEEPDTRSIPIIFLTARTDAEDVARGFRLGAVDYVTKPFRKEELLARVRTHLRLKQTERALREAAQDAQTARDEAVRTNQAKSDFLASMSHEIRTPMNGIVGMTELCLQSDLPPDLADHLETIRESARHLMAIINDILDLSKIEAGKIELETIDFDLPDLLNGTVRSLAHQATQKGLDLISTLAPDLPRYVRGDPVRLRQIILNLLSNALKFTDSGGVTLTASPDNPADSQTHPKAEPAEHEIRIAVTDTGIGIAPESLAKIFQNFGQAHGSTTRKYGGTGLGLSISRHLVTLMGGRIWVESEEGKGATFSFTVSLTPGDPAQLTTPETEPTPQPDRNRRTLDVLIADDDEINIRITKLFLSRMGHRPVSVSNGRKVLTALAGFDFDLVLMDVEMPELDGLEATRMIRSGAAGDQNRHVPIIALTGHALKEFRDQAGQAGMNDYLTKPIDFYALEALIDKAAFNPNMRSGKMAAPTDGPAKAPSPINRQEALRRMGGDKKLLAEMLTHFSESIPDIMDQLKAAVAEENLKVVADLAHSAKGLFGVIGAETGYQVADRLEYAARFDRRPLVGPLFEDLERKTHEIRAMLEAEFRF